MPPLKQPSKDPIVYKEEVFQLRVGPRLIEFPKEQVEGDGELKRSLAKLVMDVKANEIKYFCPHGEAKFGHDCGFQLVSMRDWINDRIHTMFMNCSPNQVGKTCHATIKAILWIIKTDENWPIFKEHGIEHHQFEGPKTLVVLGYDKGQLINTVWPEYQRWLPNDELGLYRPIIQGGTKLPSWDRTPMVPLKCGSKIVFLTCEQKASSAAGMKADIIHSDEQQPLTFFNELDERGRTRGGVKWIFPFTPHKVDGRPDTGAAGWLHDVWKGLNTRGHKVMRSRISVGEVPDHIYSREQKVASFHKWVELPEQTKDEESIREGQARYYGLFQQSAGLYYPEVNRAIHFIDWTYDDIKDKGWTHYRSIDYGVANATSCGMWAVSPQGDWIRYDEYYVKGKDAVVHAPAIIRACGNDIEEIKEIKDESTNLTYMRYKEVVKRQYYHKTVLDWHCFENKGGSGRPISFFFQIGGLRVLPSTKMQQEQRAQNLRALLKIDPHRRHLVTGQLGAPRMYISKKCRNWINEWEHCIFDSRKFGAESHNAKEGKRDKDDHAIDETEYAACARFRFDPGANTGDTDINLRGFEAVVKSGGY